MNVENNGLQNQTQPIHKKRYTTPQLTVHGDIATMTETNTVGNPVDAFNTGSNIGA
jgi:hypothetical protein